MTGKTKKTIGLSLIVSAITFTIGFLILCHKKKGLIPAILALGAAEGIAGYLLYDDTKLEPIKAIKVKGPLFEEDDEFFSDEELEYVKAAIDAELSQKNDDEAANEADE